MSNRADDADYNVTLIQSLIAPWGIWQCSDHRLTTPTREVYDDYSAKGLAIICPDGSALITYTGLGVVDRAGHVHTGDWLRQILRGRALALDEAFILIRERATEDLSRFRTPLIFLIGAFLRGEAWIVIISNMRAGEIRTGSRPLPSFGTTAEVVRDTPLALAAGVPGTITKTDVELVKRVVLRRPRRQQDFQKLLAAVNRRAKESGHRDARLISKWCTTSFLPPEGLPISSQIHYWDKSIPEPVWDLRTILNGIDTTELVAGLRWPRAPNSEDSPFDPSKAVSPDR